MESVDKAGILLGHDGPLSQMKYVDKRKNNNNSSNDSSLNNGAALSYHAYKGGSMSGLSTANVPHTTFASSSSLQCQGSDVKNLTKVSSPSTKLNPPEVIVPPRTNVPVTINLLNQKLESTVTPGNISRTTASSFRRQRGGNVERGSNFPSASTSSLFSCPASALQPSAKKLIVTGASSSCGRASVSTAGPHKTSNTPNVSASTGRRRTYPRGRKALGDDDDGEREARNARATDRKPKRLRCASATVNPSSDVHTGDDDVGGGVGSTTTSTGDTSGTSFEKQVYDVPRPQNDTAVVSATAATLPPTLGSNNNGGSTAMIAAATASEARTSGADTRNAERCQRRILNGAAAATSNVMRAEGTLNASRREAQSARKVLRLAELNNGALPATRELRSFAGVLSGPVASRPSLPPLLSHPADVESSRRSAAELKTPEPPVPLSTCSDALPAMTSSPAEQQRRQQQCSPRSSTATAAPAAAQVIPITPFSPYTQLPLASSSRQAAFPDAVIDSTMDYYMGISYCYSEGNAAETAKESGTAAVETVVATSDAVTAVATVIDVEGGKKPVQQTLTVPAPPPVPKNRIAKVTASEGGDDRDDVKGGEEEEEGQGLSQATFSYFNNLPDSATSRRSDRGKSGTSPCVAAAAARWTTTASVACPDTANSSVPRDVEFSLISGRGDRVNDTFFSLFPAHCMAHGGATTSMTTTTTITNAATTPSHVGYHLVPPSPSVSGRTQLSSAALTSPIHQCGAGLLIGKDGREASTSSFALQLRGRRTMRLDSTMKNSADRPAGASEGTKSQLASSTEDTVDAYSRLLLSDWTGASGQSLNESAAARRALAASLGGKLESDVLPGTPATGSDTDHDGDSNDSEVASAIELPAAVAGIDHDSDDTVNKCDPKEDSDTRADVMSWLDTRTSTLHNHLTTPSVLAKQVPSPPKTAGVVSLCQTSDSAAGGLDGASVYDSTEFRNCGSLTVAPALAEVAPALGSAAQKRHIRQVNITSPTRETDDNVPQFHHSSPHLVSRVAHYGKLVSSSTSFLAYFGAPAAVISSASSSSRSRNESNVVRRPSSSSSGGGSGSSSSASKLRDSESFALSFLTRSSTASTGQLADGDTNDDTSDHDDDDCKEEEEEEERSSSEYSQTEEDGEDCLASFSICSDFSDAEQATMDQHSGQSFWSKFELGSAGDDGSHTDERQFDAPRQAMPHGSRGEHHAAGADEGDDIHRPRRLLPISDFRSFYVPEDFISESRVSATYKVRERRTRRHFAATVVLQDPGLRGGAAADASRTPINSELNTTTYVPMSPDLQRLCALSLSLLHPNLIQTFDVFYRDVKEAEQLQSLVQACTGASDAAALTCAPAIVAPKLHTRSCKRVSLQLPAVHPPAPSETGVAIAGGTAAAAAPDSVAGCSASLHSSETNSGGKQKLKDRKGKGGRHRTPTSKKAAPQHNSSSSSRSFFRRLFLSRKKGSTTSSSSEDDDDRHRSSPSSSTSSPREVDAAAVHMPPTVPAQADNVKVGNKDCDARTATAVTDSSTLPGPHWPAEAVAELARRERIVAEMRAGRSNGGRAKMVERRARIEHLAALLVSGRVVTVLISELVSDDTVKQPTSLWEEARRGRGLPETQLMAITRGVANALHYLHTFRAPCLSLIHGAVEPRNVVVGANGVVKLASYASMHCWFAGAGGTGQSKEKMSGRTSRCAPSALLQQQQQLLSRGWSQVSPAQETAADMYGLGCTLLMLSCGAPLAYARQLFYAGGFAASNASMQVLLKGLLEENSAARLTAEEVLQCPFACALDPPKPLISARGG